MPKTRCLNRRPPRSTAEFSPARPAADVQKTLQQKVGPNVEVTQGYEALVSDASPMRADIMAAVDAARSPPRIPARGSCRRRPPTRPTAPCTEMRAFRPTGWGAYSSRTARNSPTDLNERIRVDAFYDALTYWARADQDAGGRALMSDAPGRSNRLPRPARPPRSADSPPPTHCRCARGRTRAVRRAAH